MNWHHKFLTRRELLARTLALVAGLDHRALPGRIHPPESLAAWEAERERVQAAWPWSGDAWRERADQVGAQQAGNLAQWRAVLTVLGESQAEDFGGEDPIPANLRSKLEETEAAMGGVAGAWALAKGAFGEDDWSDFEPTEETMAQILDNARHVLRARDGGDD